MREREDEARNQPKATPSTSAVLDLIHMDLCGPMRVPSINKRRYVLVMVDDYSRYTWVRFMRSKDETPKLIINPLKTIHLNKRTHVKTIRTDYGTEFKNRIVGDYLNYVGTAHEFSVARTPQQNGVVERSNRTLVEAARTMLSSANLPLYLWAEVVSTACYTQNHSILHKRFNNTPYEIMNGHKPTISYFHTFGYTFFVLNDKDNLRKFSPKVEEGVFLGYSWTAKAYRVYVKRSRTVIESINMIFDEKAGMASEHISSGPGLTGVLASGPSISGATHNTVNLNQASSSKSVTSDLDFVGNLFKNIFSPKYATEAFKNMNKHKNDFYPPRIHLHEHER